MWYLLMPDTSYAITCMSICGVQHSELLLCQTEGFSSSGGQGGEGGGWFMLDMHAVAHGQRVRQEIVDGEWGLWGDMYCTSHHSHPDNGYLHDLQLK